MRQQLSDIAIAAVLTACISASPAFALGEGKKDVVEGGSDTGTTTTAPEATPETTPDAAPDSSEPNAAEMVAWYRIRNSQDPADFATFLERYPDGTFADLARIRLAALGGATTEAPETAPEPDTDPKPKPTPVPTGEAGLGGGGLGGVGKPETEGGEATPSAIPTPAPTPAPGVAVAGSAEASPQVAACDAAAAHPNDTARPTGVPGVAFDKIDSRAVDLCRTAREAFPDHGRTAYQLGRALDASGDARGAEEAFRHAIALGYARGNLGLGYLYQDENNGLPRGAKDAFPFFRAAAEAGIFEGQFELGWAYENGLGVEQDYTLAARWYQAAADQGDLLAMNNLGWLYSEGNGVPRNAVRAIELYRVGADAGLAIAQYNMGWALQNGIGIASDLAQAADWYRRAADNGNVDAMYDLGMMYLYGDGISRDPTRALQLFQRADDAGSIEAAGYIGEVYEVADGYYDPNAAAWQYIRALKNGDDWPIRREAGDWDKATARAMQQILKDNGVYTGPIDGVMGSGSANAMRQLLPPDGPGSK